MEGLLDIAIDAARAAGELLMKRFGGPRSGVQTKSSSTDMVSDADRAAEEAIVARIRSRRPDDAFVGEEGGTSDGTSGVTWIIDPLDGTTNFLFGIPQWAVSVAARRGEETIVGVVFDPTKDEMFCAARGAGATLNGRAIRVSDKRDLSDALVATGFSYDPAERRAAAEMLRSMIHKLRDVRRAGAASLDLAWVACSRLDGYYEAPSHLWDWAAGDLIVREAGGRVEPMAAVGPSGPGLIAAGPGVFDALRALVTESHPAGTRN